MPPMSKVDLFAAIRRDSRAGLSVRALARKYQVSRRTIRSVLSSARPASRRGERRSESVRDVPSAPATGKGAAWPGVVDLIGLPCADREGSWRNQHWQFRATISLTRNTNASASSPAKSRRCTIRSGRISLGTVTVRRPTFDLGGPNIKVPLVICARLARTVTAVHATSRSRRRSAASSPWRRLVNAATRMRARKRVGRRGRGPGRWSRLARCRPTVPTTTIGTMSVDPVAHNRVAWDQQVDQGNEWSRPVSAETIAKARAGDWSVVLIGYQPVDRSWFPAGPGRRGRAVPGLRRRAAGSDARRGRAPGSPCFDNSPRQLEQDELVARVTA